MKKYKLFTLVLKEKEAVDGFWGKNLNCCGLVIYVRLW